MKNSLIVLILSIVVVACDVTETEHMKVNKTTSTSTDNQLNTNKQTEIKEKPTAIEWENLVPEGYSYEMIIDKYSEEIDNTEDDTKEAEELFKKIAKEINRAPLNDNLADKLIQLNGFIAPLNQQNGLVNEFLLVPYFGACIHVPPPPNNQTVLVKLKPGEGIKFEDAYLPFVVTGVIKTQGEKTAIGEAGYSILGADIEIYKEE